MSEGTSQPLVLEADQLAAHDLLSELRTRIAVQRLPYQHGVEARALESLWELFGLARTAMKDHPGCSAFAALATTTLNVELRPLTAKWHRAHQAGLLESRDGADAFRVDLAAIRVKLATFSLALQRMAYGTAVADAETPPVLDADEVAKCFEAVRFGIPPDGPVLPAQAMNASEGREIAARRRKYGITTPEGTDAVGLALSGGGIRSATFCMGVLQVLAARGLMEGFDYLSTVSGGGYAGSFVTSLVGGGAGFGELGRPHGPDTEPFRHVRQYAKYLSSRDLKKRSLVLAGTVAGMMLNWTAPLSVVATAAWTASALDGGRVVLQRIAGASGALAAASILAYGLALRFGRREREAVLALAASACLLLLTTSALVVDLGYPTFMRALHSPSWFMAGAAASVASLPAAFRCLPIFRSSPGKEIATGAVVVAAGVAAPVLAVTCFYLLRDLADRPADPHASLLTPLRYVAGTWIVASIALLAGLFARFALDVNATSPHRIYRDALKRTFVDTGDGLDDKPLCYVNGGQGAPYHLVNATVNLPSSRMRVLRDRRGDFFLMSKHWMGSTSTGYHGTGSWTIGGKTIGLATAMAISGAAASPQMGLETRPAFAALLTLLNVRLGLWLPKPGGEGRPGFSCLLREMTGARMSETSSWLNLSDGGHIENMGVYELLRRRCKFIVCVDGEADPLSTFHGQLTLVRHAQIDFGIRIEPRFDDVRTSPVSGFSRTHAQMFRIRYPEEGGQGRDALGLMLYLKLSMTGNESELLKGYRRLHPEFPHQSTADQFYGEEQFEAYRQLGVHVAEGTFSPALLASKPRTIPDWFEQLARNMLEPDAGTDPAGPHPSPLPG